MQRYGFSWVKSVRLGQVRLIVLGGGLGAVMSADIRLRHQSHGGGATMVVHKALDAIGGEANSGLHPLLALEFAVVACFEGHHGSI